jgi:VWFA-related protein
MFVLREYAAFLLILLIMAALLTTVFLLVAGIFYLLKATIMGSMNATRAYRRLRDRRAALIPTLSMLALLTILLYPAADGALEGAPPPDDYTINVRVDEVVLHATVLDQRGALVAGLGQSAFQIMEDGAPQAIRHFSQADVPVTVGLVIDNSGSMRPRRADVVAAALAFAASSNPQDQMFVVNFNEHVRFGLPRELPFTDQRERLQAALNTGRADGKTALHDAVIAALEHLKLGNRDKKVLIVVSDGADNASAHTKREMLALAARSGVIIYGLGIYEPDDPDQDAQVVRELARASGGRAFFPRTLPEVVPICERIARDIRNQYTLAYVPANQKQDGTYRAIEVRASSPAGRTLRVITRAGYLAPRAVLPGAAKPVARN